MRRPRDAAANCATARRDRRPGEPQRLGVLRSSPPGLAALVAIQTGRRFCRRVRVISCTYPRVRCTARAIPPERRRRLLWSALVPASPHSMSTDRRRAETEASLGSLLTEAVLGSSALPRTTETKMSDSSCMRPRGTLTNQEPVSCSPACSVIHRLYCSDRRFYLVTTLGAGRAPLRLARLPHIGRRARARA